MKRFYLVIVASTVLLSGCMMGPNYKRPATPLPGQFHGAAEPPSAGSIADKKWVTLFDDDTLKQLVNTALQHNFDLRIATERVEEARAQFGITHANQFPFLDGQANFTSVKSPVYGSEALSFLQVGAALSWELDFWGRLRRQTQAAQAQYLASEEGHRGAVVTLVATVMNTYFQLREQDLELEISRKTRDVANDNLRLVELRHQRGVVSGLDVRQAQQFLYTATAQVAAAERGIGQTEDALSLLLGGPPETQPRGKDLEQIPLPPELPAGLPSGLLARRPDIREAEQNLIAANAQIGAARALYFPQISLTASGGALSTTLKGLTSSGNRVYQVTPAALIPIFHWGQIQQQVRLSEAQERELLLVYQKSIYTALKEVSDALIGHDRIREQREQQQLLVDALTDSVRLSTQRYEGGLDSYLQVLDAQRNLFTGQLTLSELRLQELQSVTELYRALGGGWQ
ncbi:MAG TPA: efflux transporter outer membrane subunit [Bryobacteraceae bacterium]|nr:efflux transporter outer membrane subunit [Bryobacteraceae bacterium]